MKYLCLAFALIVFAVMGFAQTTPAGAPGSADTQSLKKWLVEDAQKEGPTAPGTAQGDEYDKLLAQVRAQAKTNEPQTLTDRVEFAFGKALAYAIGVGLLAIGIAVFRAKPWRWRPGAMPRDGRIALVASVLWLLGIQLWGYIWRWGSYFDTDEYIALHVAVPLLALTAWLGHRWIGKA